MAKVYKPLSSLGKIVTGKTPSTSDKELWGEEIPFITPTDIEGYDTYYQTTTERQVSLKGAKKQLSTLIPPNSICVTCIGSTIGKSCITKSKSITNQQINTIIPNDENDFRYVYYLIRESLPYFELIGGGSGSGTPIISKNKFAKFKFPVEENINIQQKIASILSAYDNLIENNNKRIKLLEQMAENLYKEWFVRFRFPDHETTEFVDGLPKGWKEGKIQDICIFERGKNLTAAEMIEGVVPVISAGISPSGNHNESNVKGTAITVSSSGANAGYLSIHYEDIWAADCSYVSQSDNTNIYYLYELLNSIRIIISNLQRGAAQPHVYPKDLNKLKVIIPTIDIIIEANQRLSNLHQGIRSLKKQNLLLAKQRDNLLPRLMSGKLEVKPEQPDQI